MYPTVGYVLKATVVDDDLCVLVCPWFPLDGVRRPVEHSWPHPWPSLRASSKI